MKAQAKDFFGIWTALSTPFNADDTIDWPAFDRLVGLQIDAGVAGLVIAGSTGEGITLSVQEKLSLIRRAKALLAGSSLQLMAATGSSVTSQSLELSKLAVSAGADSLLIVTPPYNKPNKAGLLAHFKSLASLSVPLCLYHVPGRTGQSLSAADMALLCELPQVLAVKEASGDISLFSAAHLAAPSTSFLSGDDPTFLASLAVGGQGCISVISNLFPRAMQALYEAFTKNENKKALAIHEALFPLNKALYCEANPCPLKFVSSKLGLTQNTLRLPLAPVSPESEAVLEVALAQTQTALKGLL